MKKRVFRHGNGSTSEDSLMMSEVPPPSTDNDKVDDEEEEAIPAVQRLIRPWLWCANKPAQSEEKKKESDEQKKPSSEATSVLQKKLNRLAVKIGYGGTIAAVTCFFLLVLRFGIEFGVNDMEWDHDQHWEDLLHFAIISITVLVVAVPEGLPLAVTIALAYSVQRMLKDNNLVRHLDACETMGNATTICSDKTGTLTLNRMTVVEAYLAGKVHKCAADNSSLLQELPQKLLDLLQHCIVLNCSYSSRIDEVCKFVWFTSFYHMILIDTYSRPAHHSVTIIVTSYSLQAPEAIQYNSGGCLQWFRSKCRQQQDDQLDGSKAPARQLGNVTECALLQFLQSIGFDYAQLRKEHPESCYTAVYTFNGQRKRMSSVYPVSEGVERLLCKGAPEVVLQRCDYIINEQGNVCM